MLRRQLYLTPEIERELVTVSRRAGKPVAVVVREILERTLDVRKKKDVAPGNVLLRIAARAVSGPGDLSANLTSYLYGAKSPQYGKNKETPRRR